MAKKARRINKRATLPNAPLAEVVFELRWALHSQSKSNPMLMQSDPGFVPALDSFSRKITKAGFPVVKEMASEPNQFVLPYSISRRFYAKQDFGFPLLQLGAGIFASNQTTEYEWTSFKKQSTVGTRYLLSSYPKLRGFPLEPNFLELRYIDSFDESASKADDFVTFLDEATNLNLEIPKFLSEKRLSNEPFEGRLVLMRKLSGRKSTTLVLDIASARTIDGKGIVRLESKITSQNDGVPKLRNPTKFLAEVGEWLESSHDVLSPLFKSLVKPVVMAKFEGKK